MEKLGAVEAYRGNSTETRQTAALQVIVEAEVTRHPRLNEEHREMCLGVVSVLVCSGRQEVARLGRNWRWKLVGAAAVWR